MQKLCLELKYKIIIKTLCIHVCMRKSLGSGEGSVKGGICCHCRILDHHHILVGRVNTHLEGLESMKFARSIQADSPRRAEPPSLFSVGFVNM